MKTSGPGTPVAQWKAAPNRSSSSALRSSTRVPRYTERAVWYPYTEERGQSLIAAQRHHDALPKSMHTTLTGHGHSAPAQAGPGPAVPWKRLASAASVSGNQAVTETTLFANAFAVSPGFVTVSAWAADTTWTGGLVTARHVLAAFQIPFRPSTVPLAPRSRCGHPGTEYTSRIP